MPSRRPTATESMPPPSPPPGDDNEEAPFFDNVDELQQHGINVQDILKLKGLFHKYDFRHCDDDT
ncbi:hypothetical protein SERLA73DRAFT_174405 [Serpula lacrymans var. lacrymans S7.3]|uniref:Uncharacterized protein n=2 Tax=Serpula lacrymans var. lacrymans TaxID=341189 RepID=F8PFM1_SERL3|nr:uncharacterized protein SERLADRAFT_455911 [Serpula lacrymans var. lacrymans S7.9]EGO05310.1 hypothetical protein SERLA73DRAFT_174405 [Serpula lacrymans var. lacrymans S7.3]EGO31167.1 hypothetical protein SERLADRAFT_455911 [Serpula lacrymans var. lacrymans S7.9]